LAVRRGRPSKLTPEVREALLEGIESQLPYNLACAAAGISYATFRNWMRAGEEAEAGTYTGPRKRELMEFAEAVGQADARGEAALLALIWAAATEGSWQAALAILERRHKEFFSLRHEQKVLGAPGEPIELTLVWNDVPALPQGRLNEKTSLEGQSKEEGDKR
jgi:hypothetical protein